MQALDKNQILSVSGANPFHGICLCKGHATFYHQFDDHGSCHDYCCEALKAMAWYYHCDDSGLDLLSLNGLYLDCDFGGRTEALYDACGFKTFL